MKQLSFQSALIGLIIGGVLVFFGMRVAQGDVIVGYLNDDYFKSNQTAYAYADQSASTTSTEFQDVPGLTGLSTCGRGGVTATVSMQLSGAPVEIRVQKGDHPQTTKTLDPGAVKHDPGEGESLASFTFGRARSGVLQDPFGVEWRSITGGEVTMTKGSLLLSYRTLEGNFGCA